MKSWYTIKNRAADVLEISLHDEIGLWGISAADFLRELNANAGAKVINLSVHSPGGSVLDGLAIYNALKSHKATVYGKVEGIAASAASFVLMAADHVAMPENAFLMIHNAQGGGFGDADYLRETADIIEKLQNSIVDIYHRRTGIGKDEIKEMMSVETWMSAEEAFAHGFIDTITDAVKIAANAAGFEKHFKSLPIRGEFDAASIKNERDYEKCLRESGLPKGLATALVSRAKAVFMGDPEAADEKAKEALFLKNLEERFN